MAAADQIRHSGDLVTVEVNGETTKMTYRQAVGLVSRGLASFPAPSEAKKSTSKRTKAPSGAESTPASSEDSGDPKEALSGAADGQDAESAENKPLDLL